MAEFFRNIYPHVAETNKIINDMKRFIIFDTETTGLETDAKIIQFSAVLYEKNDDNSLTELDYLDLYINPEQEISKEIEDLTGITNEQLKLAMTEKEVAEQIFTFLNRADTWGAYNAPFDLEKIYYMSKRTHMDYIKHQCIDVLVMARNMVKKETVKNHKLGTMTETLCPTYEARFHNSLEDVRATGKVFEQLAILYQNTLPPEVKTEKLQISGAKFWINPRMQNMRRLKIYSNRQDTGIFWDCAKGGWSCKANTKIQKYFRSLDIADIENQVVRMYYPRFQTTNMDDITRQWGHDYYEQNKKWLSNQAKQFKKEQKKEVVVEPIDLDIELE